MGSKKKHSLPTIEEPSRGSKQRWKDTLPGITHQRPSLVMAAQHLVNALGWSGRDRLVAARWAAAHIRAYRKSIGVESKRCDFRYEDEDMTPEDDLLWSAMSHLSHAGLFHDDSAKYTAAHLRAAEADLRELWKRGQA